MSKSLAEQIRSLMNRLDEAMGRSYDMVIPEMENWMYPADDDDESWPEYIEVGVDYSIYGSYRPATWGDRGGEPPEEPELDEYRIYYAGDVAFMSEQGEVRPGQELTNLPKEAESEIVKAIWQHAENQERDYDPRD
jgi:hypothetical protein